MTFIRNSLVDFSNEKCNFNRHEKASHLPGAIFHISLCFAFVVVSRSFFHKNDHNNTSENNIAMASVDGVAAATALFDIVKIENAKKNREEKS